MISPSNHAPIKSTRLNSLDSLRGIAALLLVIFHVHGIPQLEVTGTTARLISFFGAGVPLFYALSAFSLMIGYGERLESRGGLLHFYIRRAFRILPLFYALLIFWLVIRKFYFNAETNFPMMVLNYLCAFGIIPSQHEGLVWASWSIGVEVLFYMIFPFALIASRTLVSSFLVFLASLAISVSSQEVLGSLKDNAPSFTYMAISSQIVFFGAGLFAYRLGKFLAAKIAGFSQMAQRFIAESIFLSGIAFLLLYWLTPFAGWAEKFHLGFQMLAFAWIIMLMPIFIFGQLKTLAIPILQRAGKLSFSLYLLNPPVIFFLSQAGIYKVIYGTFSYPNIAFAISFLLTLCVLWILSELTFTFIEEKGILLGNNLLGEWKARESSESPRSKPPFLSTNALPIVFLAALPWLVWLGLTLLNGSSQVKPVNDHAVKPKLSDQSVKPKIDQPLSQKLWKSLSSNDALAADDNLKLIENGIRIHPGGSPKSATFLVDGKFGYVQFVCFINELPASALKDPLAAKAAVEIFMDGKSQGHRAVDSNTNQTFALDLSQAKELTVVVDCANGTAMWDWVNIGIVPVVPTKSPRDLVIELKSSKPGTAQVFFDLGSGLSEANSSKADVHGGANHETLRFPIPEGEITALRFDPLEDAGEIEVRSITLTSGNGAAGLSLAQVIPGQQISKSEIRDGALFIETTPDAIDPQLTIPKEALLSPSLATDKTSRDLIIELKSSKSGTAQIYYDLGTGLSEANSSKAAIYGGSDYETLHFSIPSGNFVGLRFDPFNDSGEIELRSIAMQSGESFSKIPLESFAPQYEISKFELKDGILFIQTTSDAKDPQISISTNALQSK